MLLEEDTPGSIAAVETKILGPKNIAALAAANSVIKNTTGLYDYSNAPTPVFTISPTPDKKPNYGN